MRILSQAKSRAAVLREAGTILAETSQPLDSHKVFAALLEREREGCTALDESGAAIPHCRLSECNEPVACFLRLEEKAKFAMDEVDLAFALVTPQAAQDLHLQILRRCALMFMDADNLALLRSCTDEQTLFECFQKLIQQTQ